MLTHSYRKAITKLYGDLTLYNLLNSSVLRWLQKQDDDDDEQFCFMLTTWAAGFDWMQSVTGIVNVCLPVILCNMAIVHHTAKTSEQVNRKSIAAYVMV